MQILSDKSIEAAKRAALITAALSWLVSHIPIEMLPPQFKGLSLLLKEIGEYYSLKSPLPISASELISFPSSIGWIHRRVYSVVLE